MQAHQIGAQLRAQVLRDRQQGLPLDPRRLGALVADLCGEEEKELIAPLRHLLLSAPLASAAGLDPPLGDGGQLPRLSHELSLVFAPSLCARMQPLLEGLLGLPATSAAGASAASAPSGAIAAAPPAGAAASAAAAAIADRGPAASARSGGNNTAVNALLAFLSGMLLTALAGLGLLAWQRISGDRPPENGTSSTAPLPLPPSASAPPEGAGRSELPASPPDTPTAPELPPAEESARAQDDRAVASLQQLYSALSAKDFEQARTLFTGAAADQFGPGFFRQFTRVSLQDLRVTSRTGSTLNLEGVVTFVWPDGSVQRESRSFSVETGSDPALISASEFGQVLIPRR